MSSLMQRGPSPRPPVAHYGYEQGRRREGAIAVQECMAWRLNKARRSWARAHKDLTNAFMCVSHAVLDGVVAERFNPGDVGLAAQSYREASVHMPCFDGALDVHPDTGGLMGHSVVCKLFGHSDKWPLMLWQADHRRWDPAVRLLELRDDVY